MTKQLLILMRHGESIWNRLNLFTGWVDVPLSAKGIEEALEGGKKIAHLPIDVVYTSSLIRAQMTAMLALVHHKSGKTPYFVHEGEQRLEEWSEMHSDAARRLSLPVYRAWQLNERMYGNLQGLNKQETSERFGAQQVQRWRRSFDEAPPGGESLEATAQRALPYFQEHIIPCLRRGQNVFVSAHGNSLRAIVMFLEKLSKEQVVQLEIPTGVPLLYSFREDTWTKEPLG